MRKYSVVVPVYNRPDEIDELLSSLTAQTFTNFEVLVIEDGSTKKCDQVVEKYRDQLEIRYFFKENSGQGFSRNYGYKRAKGDYFVVFDSDCLIPKDYLEKVERHLNQQYLDAYGGPDRAHPNFTPVQKAISYSMTSVFTTGGIRGSKKHLGPFHPRSFNMGISREVFAKTQGYILPKMGEDIEFSIRIIENGFKTGLIEEAFVYHKRRTNFIRFFRQLHFFGRARINVSRFFPGELRLIHTFPPLFLIALVVFLTTPFWSVLLLKVGSSLLLLFIVLIFLDATFKNRSLWVGVLSILAAFTQLIAYGVGFLTEGWRKITGKKQFPKQ